MTEYKRGPDSPTVSERATSEQRRRLLKAAATSVPVIATLPTSSAFANASVHQCVINAERTPDDEVPRYIPAGPDQYVRAQGIMGTFTNRGAEIPAIGLPRPNPTSWWRPPDGGDLLGQWVPLNTAGLPGPNNPEDVDVLVLWAVDAQGTGFDLIGVWPETNAETGSAFGVVQSCLCSVDPGTTPWCV